MPEDQLINALKNREESAFAQLVSDYQHMVFNTVLGIVQDREDSEDVAQEVFIRVYESVSRFRGDCKLSTWIYRITLTKALDFQRRKSRKKRFAVFKGLFGMNNELQGDIPDFMHPGIIAENKERSVILFKALNEIPENQKTAFVLCKLEGLSYQEIAEVMEVTVGAVESYMHRAKQNLRKLLDNYYHNE